MKKTTLFIIACIITLTGCSSYNVDPDLSEENIERHKSVIVEASKTIKNQELTDEAKIDLMENIAVSYERLGNYDKAISKFEEILEKDPTNYLALNNLVSIYEENEEYELARKYVVELLKNYSDQTETINDTIRILVLNKEFDLAQATLEEFVRANAASGPELKGFISEQFDYIQRMKNSEKK